MRFTRIVAVLLVVGVTLIGIGVAVGPAPGRRLVVEGAYFTRASGTPRYSRVFTHHFTGSGAGSASDGSLWIGAGLAGVALAAIAAIRPRTRRSPTA
jgi:hypothetical protein